MPSKALSPVRLPLRTAIIGLSANAVTSWAATGHLPYLLSPSGKKHYTITALLNSSVSAAKAAISYYNLPPSTKAYGSPEDLAADPDIDIVICNTRVDLHFSTILPSIKAGKDIFVEWPVASTSEDTKTIYQAAKESGSRVAVGLQARCAPPITRIQQILSEGKVGKVLSSEVHCFGGSQLQSDVLGPGWEYFAEKKIGGNHVSILFGHLIDAIQNVLGTFEQNTTKAHSQIQWPTIKVIDTSKDPNRVLNTITSDVPDLLYVTGTLLSSPQVSNSATLQASYQRAYPPFSTTENPQPTILWTVTCEHATIRLRVFGVPSLQADAYGKPVLIDVAWVGSGGGGGSAYDQSDGGSDTGLVVENVEWEWDERVKDIAVRARNTGVVLEEFARAIADDDGVREEGGNGGWVRVEEALRLMRQIEAWIERGQW